MSVNTKQTLLFFAITSQILTYMVFIQFAF